MSKLLENKIILVTGASRGIGRAVAKDLAKHGATVIILGRTIKDLESLYDEIHDAGLPQANIYPFNLCSAAPNDYDDLRRNIIKRYGRLDGVIHSAGILGDLTPLEHFNIQTWYQVLQVNLNSCFLLTQATLPLLKRASTASVAFTLTRLNTQPKANWGAYAVASAGLESMMRMLAAECENITNVRVNAIRPDKINTALYIAAYPGIDRSTLIEPNTITEPYVHLMSDQSLHLTGRIIDANPG